MSSTIRPKWRDGTSPTPLTARKAICHPAVTVRSVSADSPVTEPGTFRQHDSRGTVPRSPRIGTDASPTTVHMIARWRGIDMTFVHSQTITPAGGVDTAAVRSEEVFRYDHTANRSGRSPADRPG
jgi:hypothetical protein